MYGIYHNSKVIAQFVVPMTVRSNKPFFSNDSLSLKRNISGRKAQRWEIETRLQPLRETANELFALFCYKGNTGVYTLAVPQNTGSIANRRTTTSTTLGSGNINASTILITGTGKIPIGTMLKASTHNKIYVTLTERDGNGNVSVYPNLIEGFTNATIYWQDDVLGYFYLDTDNIAGMVYEDGMLMDNGTLKFIEVL